MRAQSGTSSLRAIVTLDAIDVRLVTLAWVPGVVQPSGVFEALC
jgi:hypothetical protein